MTSATTALPDWLAAAWHRSYIRRAKAPDGALGEPDSSVTVRYIQTLAHGHAFDLRLAEEKLASLGDARSMTDLSLEHLELLVSGVVECFAGVTTAEAGADGTWTLSWHGAFLFPPQLGDEAAPMEVLATIASGAHETADVGKASPTLPSSHAKPVVRWLEHALDASYEEEWLMFEDYFKQGAHLAATCPARRGCGVRHLCILGNTFGFCRDIDRAALPAAARNRPLGEVLADPSIPLEDKRRLVDCEFSFGTFGQGGGVGGVVKLSSLPWRRGAALATLLAENEEGDGVGGDASGNAAASSSWEAVRASDAPALQMALNAIRSDHEKACAQLREAEAEGNLRVAEMLRARGATA